MSDEFRRLLDDSAGAPLHAVLEAGLRDRPSPRHLARAARVLGVSSVGLGAAQSAAAAETARALGVSVWAGLAKWGAVGLLLGGAALSPLVLTTPPQVPLRAAQGSSLHSLLAPRPTAPAVLASALPAPPAVLASALPAPVQAPEIAEPRTTPSARVALTLPELRSAPGLVAQPPTGKSQPLTAAPASTVSAVRASDLDTEVALLDAARSALRQRDPNAALNWLDRHARLSAASLTAEATLLRVQALIAAGRVTEAQGVARTAIGSAKPSTYARRLSKLAGLIHRQ